MVDVSALSVWVDWIVVKHIESILHEPIDCFTNQAFTLETKTQIRKME